MAELVLLARACGTSMAETIKAIALKKIKTARFFKTMHSQRNRQGKQEQEQGNGNWINFTSLKSQQLLGKTRHSVAQLSFIMETRMANIARSKY